MPEEQKRNHPSPRYVAQNALVILSVLASALLIWQIRDALLVAFAGVILATVVTGLAALIRSILPLSRTLSFVSVGILFVIFTAGFILLFGSQTVNEFDELSEQLPQQIQELRETVRQWPLGEELLQGGGEVPQSLDDGFGAGEEQEGSQSENGEEQSENQNQSGEDQESSDDSSEMQDVPRMLWQAGTTLVDVLGLMVVIFFLGIFFAAKPELYKQTLSILIPKQKVARIHEVLDVSGEALWKWLQARLISMLFVAVVISIGLWIIGVPLALILGLIAGILDFVPYIGPVVAFLPALLLSFTNGTQAVVLTAALYLAVQQMEGNIVTPIIQNRMVNLPPAIVILSIMAFGMLLGIPGVILATPLSVIVLVVVGMLYVEDVLGKKVTIPGRDE